MYSSKDAANTSYPTQWALNPNAYQNVDSSQVDWAALAQQWIAMKEAVAIVAAPPPPSMKPDAEEGEAPMEVENPDNSDGPIPPGAEWNAATNSWDNSWNQWGWGWSGSGPVDPKMQPDPSMAMPPMMDGYNMSSDAAAQMPGYTTGAVTTPTFQHGYWTAPQVEQSTSRGSSRNRDRRSKSKNRDHKPSRTSRSQREKPSIVAPVIEPTIALTGIPTSTIDAAKRRQLPAWIREGLEKMEREKQRAIEREQEKKAQEEAEKEKKRLEEAELERMKAEAGGKPLPPPKSKFESDSEGEEMELNDKEDRSSPFPVKQEQVENIRKTRDVRDEPPPLIRKSKEEIMQEVMLTVRRSLTEILLEVTDQEIQTVSQEELARYTAVQASRVNAMKASKSKALAAIASGLGLGAYESSSEDSADDDDQYDVTDQQLQDIIKRKRVDFERTSREIEAEVRRAEAREVEEATTPISGTPERPRRSRSSATPPPVDSETPEKIPERRISKDKRNTHRFTDRVDGVKKLDTIPEERSKKTNKRERAQSPPSKNTNKFDSKENSPTSSDSEVDSSSSSNRFSSGSEAEVKVETKQRKKHKRSSSSSSDSRRKPKNEKPRRPSRRSEDKNSKSKHDEYEKSEKSKSKKRDDNYDRHIKPAKSRDHDRQKQREDSDEERPRKRTKRSRSMSYESRSGRRRASRDRSRSRRRDRRSHDRDSTKRDRRSYDRDSTKRDHDKYDRYERCREHGRRERSASRSRHRR